MRYGLRDDQFGQIENLLPSHPGKVGRNCDFGNRIFVDALGNPLALNLTGEQVHDIKQAEALVAQVERSSVNVISCCIVNVISSNGSST